MQKRILPIIITTTLALLSMTSCDTQKQPLPELVIGCDDYRPYCYIDEDGDFAGLNVEIATEVCKRIGCQPVFTQIEWDSRQTLLENGEIDCLWSFSAADGQEERYTWIPYMTSRQVVAVLKDSPIYHLSDLEGKSVAVRVLTNAEQIFLNQSEEGVPAVENLYCMTNMSDVVTALRNDYVDACAGYAAALREQLENVGVEYRLLDEDLSRATMGAAFRKDDDTDIPEKLSAALSEMRSDGTLREIAAKYVDADKALGGVE